MKRLAFALIGLASCSADTFTSDGDSGADASEDARPDGGTGEGGSCATPPACSAAQACNTFDDTQQSSFAPFSDISQAPGSIAFSTDQFVSCPQSVVATMPVGGTLAARAALDMTTPITAAVSAHGRIELDVLLPQAVTGPSTFIVLYANKDAANSGVALEWAGGQWFVRLRAPNDQKTITPRVGAWNHVALDVTFSSSGNLGKASFEYTDASGTKQTAVLQNNTLPGGAATITELAFSAGIVPFGQVTAEMKSFMDDVVFTPQ